MYNNLKKQNNYVPSVEILRNLINKQEYIALPISKISLNKEKLQLKGF